VIQLERKPSLARRLRANAVELGATQVSVHCADALDWLARTRAGAFDVCFLDPPFASDLLVPALERLRGGDWLAAGALIYVETGQATPLPHLPSEWSWLRDKRAGQVRYALAEVGTKSDGAD
jgi:16S rRNA (guanine966-N2)-methyltransferase